MNYMIELLDIVSNINTAIEEIVVGGGLWAYVILFAMIYLGAACVFAAPILPSVSLVFLVASLGASGIMNPYLTFGILIFAICTGDITAYYTGSLTHGKLTDSKLFRFVKAEHLRKTKSILDKADFITFVFARFTPVIGSLAQFTAGTVRCRFSCFVRKNVIAGILWMTFYFAAGWAFAVIPAFKNNFVLAFLLIPFFSGIIGIGYYLARNIEALSPLRKRLSSLLFRSDEI